MADAAVAVGWHDNLAATWEAGGTAKFDGLDVEHPLLLLQDESRHGILIERLWQAQAGELLPLIELRRREWVNRMRSQVKQPITINETLVTDLDELDIGQLAFVANSQRMNGTISQATEKLRRYRNKLAHIETLDYAEAFDPDLRRRSAG